MYDSYQVPAQQAPFNLGQAIIGVFVRPVEAMRAIAAARPWAIAVGIMLGLTVLGALVTLTAPVQPTSIPPDAELSPELQSSLSALSLMTRPAALIGFSFLGPIFQVLYYGFLFLIARLLSGQGRFSALFSTMVFASLPSILTIPFTLASNLLNITLLSLLIGLVAFAIYAWTAVLQVIGIRESMHFSTGRAVTTWLIPFGIALLLACILSVVLGGLLFYVIQSSMPDFTTP